MKLIETPLGEIYRFDDCKVFEGGFRDSEVFFNATNQKSLAKELFENTGILVGELKGGKNTG